MDYKEKVIALLNSQELSKEQKEKLENIFPELKEKESVEDGIRKALIEGLRAMKSNFYTISSIKIDDAIAWLEKQGEPSVEPKWCHHKVDLSDCSEEYRKAYYDGWNNCNMQHSQREAENNNEDEKIREAILQFFELQDDNTTYSFVPKQDIVNWLEKQKDYIKLPNSACTSNRDVIKFADKYSHVVWEKLMDNFKKIENYSIGCNDVSDIVLNAIINTYNWLEKQGENKPTGKVEPKFKVGDGITDGYIYYKITEILDDRYIIESKYDKRGAILFEHENRYHLWTIEDAKDGDVLVNGSNIFIFHFFNSTRLMGYCHVNIDNGRFYDDLGKNECFCLIDAVVNPATKEQCDLLFQKMKESGYEWDSKKKELKKIEVVSKESKDERIREGLIKAVSGILKGNTLYGTDVTREEALTWLEKQKEKQSIWTDSDRTMAFTLLRDVDQMTYISNEGKNERMQWLNSLEDKFNNGE